MKLPLRIRIFGGLEITILFLGIQLEKLQRFYFLLLKLIEYLIQIIKIFDRMYLPLPHLTYLILILIQTHVFMVNAHGFRKFNADAYERKDKIDEVNALLENLHATLKTKSFRAALQQLFLINEMFKTMPSVATSESSQPQYWLLRQGRSFKN